MSGDQKLVTVSGWVTPASGSEGARVAVAPDSGQDYLVLHRGAGVDLLGHISARVEVIGVVVSAPQPPEQNPEEAAVPPYLMVRRYRVLDDDWEEET